MFTLIVRRFSHLDIFKFGKNPKSDQTAGDFSKDIHGILTRLAEMMRSPHKGSPGTGSWLVVEAGLKHQGLVQSSKSKSL